MKKDKRQNQKKLLTWGQSARRSSRQVVPLIELILSVPVLFLFTAIRAIIPYDASATGTGIMVLTYTPDQALDRERSRRRASRDPQQLHGRRLQLVARRADVEFGLLHARVHGLFRLNGPASKYE